MIRMHCFLYIPIGSSYCPLLSHLLVSQGFRHLINNAHFIFIYFNHLFIIINLLGHAPPVIASYSYNVDVSFSCKTFMAISVTDYWQA